MQSLLNFKAMFTKSARTPVKMRFKKYRSRQLNPIEHNRGIVPVGVESVVGWHLAKVVPASVVGALGRPLPGFVERILAR